MLLSMIKCNLLITDCVQLICLNKNEINYYFCDKNPSLGLTNKFYERSLAYSSTFAKISLTVDLMKYHKIRKSRNDYLIEERMERS